MRSKRARAIGVAIIGLALTLGISACGGDDNSGNETDRAFVAGMVPHHQMAIQMAEMAKERGQSEFVRRLADDITTAQSSEIGLMSRIDAKLSDEGVEVGDLGMPEHLAGMEGSMSELESARPFDRAFIDMMIAHHAGAIRMARIEADQGQDDQLVALAGRVIAAQSREIRAMNAHRAKAFGAPSPSGGVPAETSSSSMEGMDHSGH